MFDVTVYWGEAQSWLGLAVGRARSLSPAFLVALAAAPVVALLCRSLTAALIAVLASFLALLALRIEAGPVYEAGVVAVSALTGLLATLLAVFLRRAKRRSREAGADLDAARQELEAIREKHEREVQWRQAGEKLSGHKPFAVPS